MIFFRKKWENYHRLFPFYFDFSYFDKILHQKKTHGEDTLLNFSIITY